MATLDDKIEKIESVGEELKVDGVDGKRTIATQPVDGKFQELMNSEEQVKSENSGATKQTLEDVARIEAEKVHPSIETQAQGLIAQTKEAVAKIEAIKADLQTQQVDIKKPVDKLMTNKLTHIEDSIRIALTKAGAENVDIAEKKAPLAPIPNPVAKFLDHLTHAQDQLENLGSYMEAIVNTDKELSPANMLAVQIKVNNIQQELEFFTSLLNKSLESTKALMNVQV